MLVQGGVAVNNALWALAKFTQKVLWAEMGKICAGLQLMANSPSSRQETFK